MRKGYILIQCLIWISFLLLPVAMCVWMIAKGYAVWNAMLTGCGVLLVESVFVAIVTTIAACIRAAKEERRDKEKN